jgi:hypothetical protein
LVLPSPIANTGSVITCPQCGQKLQIPKPILIYVMLIGLPIIVFSAITVGVVLLVTSRANPPTQQENPIEQAPPLARFTDPQQLISAEIEVIQILNLDRTFYKEMFGADLPEASGLEFLAIELRVTNTSKSNKVLNLTYWSGGPDVPHLHDEFDNRYNRLKIRLRTTTVHPDESVRDTLFFERVLAKADTLDLELPSSAFDQRGEIHLKIPTSFMVTSWVKKLKSGDPGIRRVAAVMLGKLGLKAKSAAPFLIEAMENAQDIQLQTAADNALRLVDPDRWDQLKKEYAEAEAKAREKQRLEELARQKRAQEAKEQAEREALKAEKEAREAAQREKLKEEEARIAEAKEKALRLKQEAEIRQAKKESEARKLLFQIQAWAKAENYDKAVPACKKLIGDYHGTEAAKEGKRLLVSLEKAKQTRDDDLTATAKLKLLERLVEESETAIRRGDPEKATLYLEKAETRLNNLIKKYPKTDAAKKAKDLLKEVETLQKKITK